MANSYSIEIGGRFNAAQLQQALDQAAKGKLNVTLTANAQQMQQAVRGVETSMKGAVAAIKHGTLQFTEYADSAGNVYKNVEKVRNSIRETIETTRKLNDETGKMEISGRKIVQNYEAQFKAQQKLARQTQADLDRRAAKEQRELEILERRLGVIQKGVNLRGASKSDILEATGLPSNATITPSGAFTPVAGQGTWQRYIVSVQEGARAFRNYAVNVNEATGETRKLDQGITETNKALAAQGETWDRLIVKVAKWALLTSVIYAPIRAFKEALSTMKEVDSELVTIQKVTDLTARQIDGLTQSIYGMASAYGRTADELLQATSTFARAGFQDNLEQMTELSALLQNVGDISSENASKFLIAANAAWNLGGNYDSLMRIIDGMNEVTNKSANDIQALTDGITVAGSVFANAGESAQTFTAMVGTVVASTQRSGSEVARGLRTIAMNIRQIKGELEDGEIIDEASISDAAAALHSVGVSVSQNGELRKVSDVLGDLAGKWDTLTSAEQSYVASSLAGKRQANVLIALMQNYSEYQYELSNYANSAGSALRENEIYLDSWEAKTAVLSAKWTEFVSNLVETSTVKTGLDVVISAVDLLNSSLGQTVVVLGAITAITNVGGKQLGLQGLGQAGSLIGNGMAVGAPGSGILAALKTTTLPIFLGAGLLAGAVAIYDRLTVSLDEQREIVEDLSAEYDKMFGKGSEYDQLKQRVDSLNESEKARLSFLEAQRGLMEQQVKLAKEEYDARRMAQQHQAYREVGIDENGVITTKDFSSISAHQLSMIQSRVSEAGRNASLTGDIGAYKSELADILTTYEEVYDLLKNTEQPLDDVDVALLSVLDTLLKTNSALVETESLTESVAEKVGFDVAGAFTTLDGEINLVASAIDEYNSKQFISQETMDALLAKYPDLITQIHRTADGYTVEDGALQGLIADHEKEAAKIEYYARSAAIQYINALDAETRANHNLGLEINATTNEIMRQLLIAQAIAAAELNTHVAADAQANWGGELARNLKQDNEYAASRAKLANINTMIANVQRASKYSGSTYFGGGGTSSKSSGGGGSSRSTSAAEETDPTAELIRAKKAEFDYAIWLSQQQQGLLEKDTQAYKDKTAEQAEYYVAMQKWAHEEADRLRAIDADKYKSEIQDLQKYWWEAQNWLVKSHEDALKAVQSSVKNSLDKLKQDLDDESESLDARLTRVKALINLEEQYYSMLKSIRTEQADISEQLRVAKESYQYLDEETRKLLFNEEDYAELSKELRDIQRDTVKLYDEYTEKVNALSEDNIYAAEALTNEYERQLAAKQKEYDIAKANLALAKAQTQYQNTVNNRDTLMLINGQFQWVADPKAVKSALEELADAEEEAAEARRAQTENDALNSKKALQNALEAQKTRIDAEYKAISKAWNRLSDSMEQPVADIQQTLQELADNAAPEFKTQIISLAQLISQLTGQTITIDGQVVEQKAQGAGGYGRIAYANSDKGSSNYGDAPTGLAVGTTVYTHGGTYQIVEPGTAGASYNPSSGYYSIKIDDKATYDEGGVANGIGIMLKNTSRAEGVLGPTVMSSILNPQKNALFETFVGSLTSLFGGNNSGMSFRGMGNSSSLVDNSITVNGMEVTGRKGESLADALTQIMPLHAGGRM